MKFFLGYIAFCIGIFIFLRIGILFGCYSVACRLRDENQDISFSKIYAETDGVALKSFLVCFIPFVNLAWAIIFIHSYDKIVDTTCAVLKGEISLEDLTDE